MDSLIKILRSELGVDEDQARLLESGLHDALGYHQQMQGMYSDKMAIGEYKAEITRAANALKKLNDALNKIGIEHAETLDTMYYAANAHDRMMMDIALKELAETGSPTSGFQTVAIKMEKAISIALNDVRKPGSGGARKQAKEYIAGIEMLMRWFSDVCPNNKLSAKPSSKFYKYVDVWFAYIVQEEKADITRHIENALNHPHVRQHH